MNSPCIKCNSRNIGCHGTCSAYTEFQSRLTLMKNRRNLESQILSYKFDRSVKYDHEARTGRAGRKVKLI